MKSRALLIGVSDSQYADYDPIATSGCKRDIRNMQVLLSRNGFGRDSVVTLESAEAIKDNVLGCLKDISIEMEEDDFFVFYFSGHGIQVADNSDEESDKNDEAIVLFDMIITDDELTECFAAFRPNVRIFLLLDCCNSGSLIDPENYSNGQFPIMVKLIYIGGTKDGEKAVGAPTGSIFTSEIIHLCRASGKFQGDYSRFYSLLSYNLKYYQAICYREIGPVDDLFRCQRPFQI